MLSLRGLELDVVPKTFGIFFTLEIPKNCIADEEKEDLDKDLRKWLHGDTLEKHPLSGVNDRDEEKERWRIIYRSEMSVRNVHNPSWMPLDMKMMTSECVDDRGILLADEIRICLYALTHDLNEKDISPWRAPHYVFGETINVHEIYADGVAYSKAGALDYMKYKSPPRLSEINNDTEDSSDMERNFDENCDKKEQQKWIMPAVNCFACHVIRLIELDTFGKGLPSIPEYLPVNSIIIEFTNGLFGVVPSDGLDKQEDHMMRGIKKDNSLNKENENNIGNSCCIPDSASCSISKSKLGVERKPDDLQSNFSISKQCFEGENRISAEEYDFEDKSPTTVKQINVSLESGSYQRGTPDMYEFCPDHNEHRTKDEPGLKDPNAKYIALNTFKEQLKSYQSLHSRIINLKKCVFEKRRANESTINIVLPLQLRFLEIQKCGSDKAEVSKKIGETQKRLMEIVKIVESRNKTAFVSAQALISTLQALQSANRQVRDAKCRLDGPSGRGRLLDSIRNLVARRCLMVIQTAATYRFGPSLIKVVQPPPGGLLDTHIDIQWSGGTIPEGFEELRVNPDKMAALAATSGPNLRTKTITGKFSRNSATLPSADNTLESALFRHEVRLTIGGLEVNPSTWAGAFDPHGRSWDPVEDRIAGIALGYVAHFVSCCANYLNIPLRYPIRFCGSQSSIFDNWNPVGEWNPSIASSMYNVHPRNKQGDIQTGSSLQGAFLFRGISADQDQISISTSSLPKNDIGRENVTNRPGTHTHQIGKSSNNEFVNVSDHKVKELDRRLMISKAVEYPLHCESNRERPNFAIAVFLLNKNILQLLQAYGISALGPNQILENIHKLVAAAQSGLPPQTSLHF